MLFTFPGGSIESPKDIDALDGKTLVVCYNTLTGKTTKKFSCRSAGNVQTRRAYETWKAQQPGGAAKVDVYATVSPNTKSYRPDSNRGKVIELCRVAGGCTIADLKKATKWESDDVRACLSRIKSYNGLSVEITGEGDEALVVISGVIRTRKAFFFEPKKVQKAHKEGTKRSIVLNMLLKDGATIEEIKAAAEWDDRTAYEGVRLLNGYLGYGLRETPDGKIHAYTK